MNALVYGWHRYGYEFSIDKSIKDRVGEIVMFTSDNEEEDGKRGLEMFHGAIGGKEEYQEKLSNPLSA